MWGMVSFSDGFSCFFWLVGGGGGGRIGGWERGGMDEWDGRMDGGLTSL